MRHFILLEVKEIFKKLLLLRLMVFLSHETLSSTNSVLTKNFSVHNFLKHVLVPGVFDFVINLSQTEPREERLEHFSAAKLKSGCEFAFRAVLQTMQYVKKTRLYT